MFWLGFRVNRKGVPGEIPVAQGTDAHHPFFGREAKGLTPEMRYAMQQDNPFRAFPLRNLEVKTQLKMAL